MVINYKDDGKGIPESVTPESSPGFGMQLVSMLARQMDGSVRIEGEPRTEFVIEFILK